jgi:hypothetical protein
MHAATSVADTEFDTRTLFEAAQLLRNDISEELQTPSWTFSGSLETDELPVPQRLLTFIRWLLPT